MVHRTWCTLFIGLGPWADPHALWQHCALALSAVPYPCALRLSHVLCPGPACMPPEPCPVPRSLKQGNGMSLFDQASMLEGPSPRSKVVLNPNSKCNLYPTLIRPPTCCYVWGTVRGGCSHALSQFCVNLHLYYTSSHPTSAQYPIFYTAEPRRAYTYI